MDLSSPKLKKILVGVAIFVVVVFIVIRFFRRSNYAYPNASEEGSFSITTAPTVTAVNGSTPSLATFTTTAPHGFSVGDLIYISGVTGLTYTEPVTGYPAGAAGPVGGSAVYIYSIPAGVDQMTFTVKATAAGSPVQSVAIPSAGIGAGYTSAPNVTFSDPPSGGTRASGTAVIGLPGSGAGAGKITGVIIPAGSGGSGYTQAPTITFAGGNPTTAASTAGVIVNLGTTPITVSSASVKNIVQPSQDKMKNTDMLACQTQYATDLITASSTLTGMSPQTINGTARTINVTSASGFQGGDKVLIPGVVDSAGKAVVLVVESAGATSLTFTAASVPTTATILPQTAVSNITTAYSNRTACIQMSATTYTVGHCRYLPQAGTNRPIVPLQSDDPVAYAAYLAYQTDIQAIQLAYTGPLSRATQNSNFPAPTSGTVAGSRPTQAQQMAIVEAARKADLANATQKYLASVCPGFYAQTSGLTVTDPSTEYKKWSIVTGQNAPTVTAQTVGTEGKKFWAPPQTGITDASIMDWAQGAGIVTLSGPVLSVTIPSPGIGTYSSPPTGVTFTAPTTGTTATGTPIMSGGKITGVTLTNNGGSGYTTNPTITAFTGGTATTAPTADELASIVVQISTSLSATAPLIPVATTTGFSPTGGSAAVTYSANRYTLGTGDNVNWRVAYKNGPGTYPKPTYAAS